MFQPCFDHLLRSSNGQFFDYVFDPIFGDDHVWTIFLRSFFVRRPFLRSGTPFCHRPFRATIFLTTATTIFRDAKSNRPFGRPFFDTSTNPKNIGGPILGRDAQQNCGTQFLEGLRGQTLRVSHIRRQTLRSQLFFNGRLSRALVGHIGPAGYIPEKIHWPVGTDQTTRATTIFLTTRPPKTAAQNLWCGGNVVGCLLQMQATGSPRKSSSAPKTAH